MYLFKGNHIPAIYTKILEKILTEGKEVGPRGLKTKELSPVCIEITDPRRRLFGHPHRKEVPIFTYIEGIWMLNHENKPERVVHYVPAMANFVNENTGVFDGAYGPLISNQLEHCYERLSKDSDSRQAVVIINNPLLNRLPTKDYPCTLSFQFLLRNNKLDMVATMRSQDAWLGLIYDTGEFQWFQEILAGWLDVELGRYIHIDGSLHLYESSWVKAQEVIDKDSNFSLYDKAKVYDARLPKIDFDIILHNLSMWEECCRISNFDKIQRSITFRKSKFYSNLVSIISAYNIRLQGFKDESYKMVEDNNSDLGIIYKNRWKPK